MQFPTPNGIAGIAALIGDPARAAMMAALMDGRARTAKELASLAGITPQTGSAHLARLTDAALLRVSPQGRHRYYRLAGSEAAHAVESLGVLAALRPGSLRRTGPRDPALREARTCYDHLAGRVAVAILDGLREAGGVTGGDAALDITPAGQATLARIGLDLAAARQTKRPFCRACLDWSERRPHMAGGLGAALLLRCEALGWIRRAPDRAATITPAGRAGLAAAFGVPFPQEAIAA